MIHGFVKRSAVPAGLLMAGLLASATPAFAQEQEGPTIPLVSLRETAAALVHAGTAHGDARAVLAAAQLMITAEREVPGLTRIGETAVPEARREEAAKGGDLSAASLLQLAARVAVEQGDARTARAAAELAGNTDAGLGDAELAVELSRSADALETTRGAEGGPLWADGYLASGGVEEYRITFEGGQVPNRITVSASSSRADLDCYLYDGDQLMARDDEHRSDCSIRWSQQLTGTITLRVRNAGAGTHFVLASN